MSGDGRQISNPFSTGGGGVNFEVQVQASFVALMLAGGFAPCLHCRPIRKIKLQGKYAGYDTDDLIVFTGNEDGTEERKILGQVKHSITITNNDTVFGNVIARRLVDGPFAEWQSKIRHVLQLPGSPLSLRNGVWSVRQRGDLWKALGSSVFDSHLDGLGECALAVLAERDPQFDLVPDERFTANIHGKVLAHSRYLRKGLAESLALTGSRPEFLKNCSRDKEPLNKSHAVKALLDAVSSSSERSQAHDAIQVIKSLQEDTETNENDLFRIEWAYVTLLDGHHGATPKYLESRLANDPAFFCELIRMIFRSRTEASSDEEPTEDKQTLATNAWRLLHEWRTPPGTDRLGNFSGPAFKQWIDDVRQSASDSGHLEVALSNAGNVLIHSPPDPKGLTIHRAVAEVLNADDSEEMRRGFAMAIHNSRGVHFVDPTGKPERDLAAKYRDQAEEMENAGFHRLATTLRGIAESYDREAERIVEEHKTELEEDE